LPSPTANAEDDPERLPGLAVDLVREQADGQRRARGFLQNGRVK
jgi:hypothetical protein